MKLFLLLCLASISLSVYAQPEEEFREASKESQAYHKYRLHLTTPAHGLEKIHLLIKKQVMEDEENNLVLKDAVYNSLSAREKFTYNMIHGETYSQICDAMPPIQDEQTKIFGYLPDVFNEYTWSERQVEFFTSNKDSVMQWIKVSVAKSNRIGINYKQAILEMKANEMIPFLIKTYLVTRKDHDILTLMMLLMKENNYEPFAKSPSFDKLYGENSSYLGHLAYNKANEDLIIKRASEFYEGSKH